MGLSKKEEFSARQNKIADIAKALGHPARIAILEFLSTSDSCICGSIVDKLPLSQSTVSQHLRELKNAGLIKGEIDGARVCYCINDHAFEEARELLGIFLNKKSCC
jgi:DNA-binding transcriptional ArsR family regulator